MPLRTTVTIDLYTKAVLTVIAILLAVLVTEPIVESPAVHAQSDHGDFYIEPGTTILRNVDGTGEVQVKVVIDRRTGDIYGFPTRSSAPYPVVMTSHQPPVSRPMYLGKFDFSAANRR